MLLVNSLCLICHVEKTQSLVINLSKPTISKSTSDEDCYVFVLLESHFVVGDAKTLYTLF